jgi:hypothetical protein
MAELVDAPDLGSGGRKLVGVQVPLLALLIASSKKNDLRTRIVPKKARRKFVIL